MNVNLLLVKVKFRMNKSDSSDFDNIEPHHIVEAYNKAQKEWCRRQLHGGNQYREGDEQTKQRVNDLQILLKDKATKGTNFHTYFETEALPDDLLYLEKISTKGKTKECINGKIIDVKWIEEGNVNNWLSDWSTKPSFEWAKTFHTVLSNKVRIYHNGEFSIIDPVITYYRQPKDISVANYEDINGIQRGDIDPEFKDDVVELLIDETVAILSADIESFSTHSIAERRKEANN